MAGYIGKSQGKILTNVDGNSVETADIQDSAVTETKIAAGSVTDTKLNSTKLDGIEAGADVTDTANVTAAGALMDSEVTNLAAVKAFDPTDYATAAQGALAASALQSSDIGVSVQAYSATLAGTTASFTTADETKLDGIEAGADITDTANVTAAGALMDSEVTNLAQVKAFDSTDYATAAQGVLAASALQSSDIGVSIQAYSATLAGTTASYTTAEETKLAGIETGATADQTAAEILTAIKTVDGAGSGLDADTVDGIQASNFLRSDADDITTGNLGITPGSLYSWDSDSGLSALQLNGYGALWNYYNNVVLSFNAYQSSTGDKYMTTDDAAKYVQDNTGVHVFYTAPSGTAGNAITWTERMRVNTSGATVTGTLVADGVSLGDNEYIQLGASSDLQIFHDGSNSYVRDVGTGNLNLSGDQVNILNSANNETKASFNTDGSCSLNYDDSTKLATTSTGVTVTGTVAATAFTGDGSGLTNLDTFNDNNLVNDVSTLSLRLATLENAIAYNTSSQFIDVFQDDSGVSSITNAEVSPSEYVSTVYDTPVEARYWRLYKTSSAALGSYHNELYVYSNGGTVQETVTSSMLSMSGLQAWNPTNFVDGNNGTNGFHTDSAGVGSWFKIDFGAGNEKALDKISIYVNNPSNCFWDIQYSNDNSSWTTVSSNFQTSIGTGYATRTWTQPTTSVSNATGNFIGTAVTASSSVSSMGGIITYEDNAGTNTLNTDISLELSANNGTNWSTATLTALPNYSSSIKMAKVNDLAVTAGTSLKYRISFANQSASKIARIRGVALQY